MKKSRIGLVCFLMIASFYNCSLTTAEAQDKQSTQASFAMRLDPALRESMLILLDTNSPSLEFYSALKAIFESPVSEKPELWTRIANGNSYDAERRCEAILAFFKRHVKSGTRLFDLVKTPGLTNWFSRELVWKSTIGSAEFLERSKGECAYSLSPIFCKSRNGKIVMSLPKYIPDDDMDSYMTGTKKVQVDGQENVIILEVEVLKRPIQQNPHKLDFLNEPDAEK